MGNLNIFSVLLSIHFLFNSPFNNQDIIKRLRRTYSPIGVGHARLIILLSFFFFRLPPYLFFTVPTPIRICLATLAFSRERAY